MTTRLTVDQVVDIAGRAYLRGYEQGFEYAHAKVEEKDQADADALEDTAAGPLGSRTGAPSAVAPSPSVDTSAPAPDVAGADAEGEGPGEPWFVGSEIRRHVYQGKYARFVGAFSQAEDAELAALAVNSFGVDDNELVQRGMVLALKAAAEDLRTSGQFHAANLLDQRAIGVEASTVRRLA